MGVKNGALLIARMRRKELGDPGMGKEEEEGMDEVGEAEGGWRGG